MNFLEVLRIAIETGQSFRRAEWGSLSSIFVDDYVGYTLRWDVRGAIFANAKDMLADDWELVK